MLELPFISSVCPQKNKYTNKKDGPTVLYSNKEHMLALC